MPDRPSHGTRVRYYGTLTDLHGEYIYDGFCGCDNTGDDTDFSDGCDEDSPNRHQLSFDEPAGADGRRRHILHVRRRHFTPVAETPAIDREEHVCATDARADHDPRGESPAAAPGARSVPAGDVRCPSR